MQPDASGDYVDAKPYENCGLNEDLVQLDDAKETNLNETAQDKSPGTPLDLKVFLNQCNSAENLPTVRSN